MMHISDFYDLMEDELRDNEFNNNRIVNGITNGTHGIVKVYGIHVYACAITFDNFLLIPCLYVCLVSC